MAEIILTKFVAEGLDTLSAELGQVANAQEQVIQGQVSLRTQLRQNQQALAQLALAGKQNTDEYKKLRDEAGRLKDAISDAAAEISQAGSDTRGLDKALRATNVLVGGFAAVQGATALFGKESENLQKTLLKVNAAMSILAGLQQIQEELTRKDSILVAAAAKARQLYTAATTGATAATRVLMGVLSGGLLLALGLVIANWQKITKYLGIAKESTEDLAAATEKLQKIEEQRKATQDAELRYLKAKGASQEEIIQREIALAKIELQKLETQKALEAGIAGFSFNNPNDPDNLKKQEAAKKRVVEVEENYKVAILNARSAILELEKSLVNSDKAEVKSIETKELLDSSLIRLRKSARELAEAEKDRATGLETIETLEQRILRLREASADLNKQVEGGGVGRATGAGDPVVNTFQKRTEAAQAYFQLISETNSQIDSVIQKSQEAQLQRLQQQRARGLITEKQYIQEVQALKKKQAEQDKKLSIFNIILNTAQAITKALTAGPIIGPILAAIIGGLGAAELAIARRTPLPGFKKGVIDIDGPGTATSDSIHARLSKGESVMTAEETKNHKEVLWAIRKKKFDKMFVPTDEVIKKHKPLSIPSGAFANGKADNTSHKLDKIYEELVYQNIYTKEGNRVLHKSNHHLQALKTAQRYGIRV